MKNLPQSGYISIILIIFLLILGFLVYPRDFPKRAALGCVVGDAPQAEETITLPRIIGRDNSNDNDLAGFDNSQTSQYKLIRKNALIAKNVFHDPTYTHMVKYDQPLRPGFDIYYPYQFGEIDLYRELTLRYVRANKREVLMRREGLIFFIHLNPDGTPKEVNESYMTDVYQDEAIFNLTNKGYTTEELFVCPDSLDPMDLRVAIPNQFNSPDKKQLQLQWFTFRGKNYMEAHCKPAIYLYPKEKTLVNVRVNTKGLLTYVDPPYDSNAGWTVTAYPNGSLILQTSPISQTYPYLYYESKLPQNLIQKPQTGWVVEKNNLEQKFNELLPQVGLNSSQTRDFIDYWTKALPDSPFYFIGLISEENLNEIEPLKITPKPDFLKRVRVYFEPLSQPKVVPAPDLSNWKLEIGNWKFHAVEWGGMVKRHDGEFICSE